MSKHRSTRTTNSTARRALAGCTIAGAALFATVSGGQAWATVLTSATASALVPGRARGITAGGCVHVLTAE
ncbi:hypothetical protein ABZ497_33365, partial [Kitasatospora sp. NPDC005751]